MNSTLSIIGTGNLGSAIAQGLLDSNILQPNQLILTRRKVAALQMFKDQGVSVTSSNIEAVTASDIIILAVEPHHAKHVLDELSPILRSNHILLSVVTGLETSTIKSHVSSTNHIARAMPNTAIALRASMTCLCGNDDISLVKAQELFEVLGETLVIEESLMSSATALAACGIAFFLRAIRAAGQGGTQIGFSSEDAIKMAAQTAKGAASLLLTTGNHPEREIDKVTTPMGCTIAGLNQMEHEGFSSAMIRGIITSAEKASGL